MLESLVTLLILAVLCEAVVEWAKTVVPAIDIGRRAAILSLVVGLVLAFGAGQDLLALIGVPFTWPHVGTVLAGIVMSRGSNYIHNLVKRVSEANTPPA